MYSWKRFRHFRACMPYSTRMQWTAVLLRLLPVKIMPTKVDAWRGVSGVSGVLDINRRVGLEPIYRHLPPLTSCADWTCHAEAWVTVDSAYRITYTSVAAYYFGRASSLSSVGLCSSLVTVIKYTRGHLHYSARCAVWRVKDLTVAWIAVAQWCRWAEVHRSLTVLWVNCVRWQT